MCGPMMVLVFVHGSAVSQLETRHGDGAWIDFWAHRRAPREVQSDPSSRCPMANCRSRRRLALSRLVKSRWCSATTTLQKHLCEHHKKFPALHVDLMS